MTKKLVILMSGTVFALAACGKHEAATNDANIVAVDNGAATNTGAVAPLTSQGFANAAAASDKFEIDSSKLASTAGQSAAIKSFAAKMITAHEGSTAKLKATAGSLSPAITPDDTLSSEQQASLDNLKGLRGADFDKGYAAAQVDAHQKALDALNAYAASGDNSQLEAFAKGLVPTVTAHLNTAKGLR